MTPSSWLLAVLAVLFTASPALAEESISGAWEGYMNDQPAVELTIKEVDGKASGSIAFHFQRRGEDGKWKVEGKANQLTLLEPRLDGNKLSFEVVHHKSHGSSERGPNAKFRFELVAPGEGRLFKIEEGSDGGGSGLKMTRKK